MSLRTDVIETDEKDRLDRVNVNVFEEERKKDEEGEEWEARMRQLFSR